jgi:hypothetical protein
MPVSAPWCCTTAVYCTYCQKNYQQSGNNDLGFHNYLSFGYSISDTILKPEFNLKPAKFTIGDLLTICRINQKLFYLKYFTAK